MRIDYPGIGGSLGQCILCGESFALEVLMGRSISTLKIEGFGERDLPIHAKCVETMESLRGKDWTALPDGPLRREYAECFADAKGSRVMEAAIITNYWAKPIPDRNWDWSAHVEGQEEGFTGYGSTEDEAIADLRGQMGEAEAA